MRDLRQKAANKGRREMRQNNPAKMRGSSCVIRSLGYAKPLESENLCLFTCIAMHIFKCNGRTINKVLSRCVYILYKLGIAFNKERLQLVINESSKRGRTTLGKLLLEYLRGGTPSRGKKEALFLINEGKKLLKACEGQSLDDLISVEDYFNVRLRLWTRGGPEFFYASGDSEDGLSDDGLSTNPPSPSRDTQKINGEKKMYVKCLFPSSRNSGEIIDLSVNTELTHVDLIRDINVFGNMYICTKCDQNFSDRRNCQVHEDKCGASSNTKYVGGVFNPTKTVFERLEENEISVPHELKFVEYFIVFDFESLLVPIPGKDETQNGRYEEHVPVSVAVGSNINPEAMKGYFLRNSNPLELIREFVELLLKLSDEIFETIKPKYQTLFDMLEEKICVAAEGKNVKQGQILKRLRNDLHNLLRRAITLSYNGSKYDMVLILGYFFQIYKEMGNFDYEKTDQYKEDEGPPKSDKKPLRSDSFVRLLQRGSQILTLVTDKLVFKDISLFLAPGCSYKKYLQNHSDDVEKLEKLIFPYKMAKSFECLNSTEFPKFEDFWCDLRQEIGISKEQYEDFIKAWRDPKNPNLIKEGKTLLDILSEYNLGDCAPLARAVQKHMNVYKNELGIDLFFEYISLPSVGLKWMFTGEKEKFYNFPQQYGFLHRQIQRGRTGGLCTVFKRKSVVGEEMRRYHEPGGPVIETPRICQAITFVDATSLYPAMYWLYEFFVGAPIYRRSPDFLPERVGIDHGVSAESHTWLRYCEKKYNVRIISGHNDGEVSVGSKNYPVDGYVRPTRAGDRGIVFEYDNCRFHGHDCEENNIPQQVANMDLSPIEKEEKIKELKKDAKKRLKNTIKKREFLLNEGYEVVSIFSCEWSKQQKEKRVKDVLIATGGEDCTLYPKTCLPKSGVTTPVLIQKVKDGQFHGLLKVDIYLEEPWATKYEFFPFFCQNQLVYRENLSPEMQRICKVNGALKRPSKQLVSTSNAKSLILTSELLKWYLNHHAKVDHVHWCLEYKKAPVFRDKIEKMVEWRRASINDKNLKAQADCAKLLSNSSIGKTGEDVSRHKNTKICGISQVHKYVDTKKFLDATPIPTPAQAAKSSLFLNQRQAFRDILNETDEFDFDMGDLFTHDDGGSQLYMVETEKRRHVFKTPSTVQFTVYNYAKQHMLTLAIDILMVYPVENSVSIIYHDTDSLGCELGFPTLDLCISKNKRREYFSNVRHKWFPREWCDKCFNQYLECKISGGEWDYKACIDCHEIYKREFFTPGIFKVEQNGDRFVALSPKMYVLEDTRTGEIKSGTKGVSQRCNNLNYDILHSQLMGKKDLSTSTNNYQFSRNKIGGVCTSKMEKFSVSKLYWKRRTMGDNINTLPLLRKKVGNYDVVTQAYADDDDDKDGERPLFEKTILEMMFDEIFEGELKDAVDKYVKDPAPPCPPCDSLLEEAVLETIFDRIFESEMQDSVFRHVEDPVALHPPFPPSNSD